MRTAKIIIHNMKKTGNQPPSVAFGEIAIRVDRQSPLGNPFQMKDDSFKERERVCDLYEDWFFRKLAAQDRTICNQINNIVDACLSKDTVYLCCWCFPERCHTETIRSALLKILEIRTEADNKIHDYLERIIS